METNSPTDEPTPAPAPEIPAETPPAAEPPVEASASVDSGEPLAEFAGPAAAEPVDAADSAAPEGGAPDELGQLAEASQRARLTPADEERMGQLLKEALQGGRAGVARAVEVLPRVPWIVGVRAVEAVWPDLTAGFRTQMVSGLAKDESDASRRIRLSLARAFFKIDMPTGLKVAAGVVRELRDAETGLITTKQAQIFANVFIGRGKPWLAQLSLAEMKPADGDALAHCAVLAVFTLPHPPVTQLGVLKWVAEQGRLGKLDAAALEVMKKGLSRWSAKWQGALRKEVEGLPEEVIAFLKPVPETARETGEEPAAGAGEGAEAETAATGEGTEGAAADLDDEDDEDEDDDEEDDEDDDEDEDDEREKSRKERPVYEPRPQRQQAERPVYTPRNAGGGVPRNFNINESLRSIDAYVQSLRNDLSSAQAKLRTKEDRRRPEKAGPIGAIVAGEPTIEELSRLNLQLEARNLELQDRIKELTQHAEDVAVSTGALTGQPVDDGAAQLRTLLALKLHEDFADFHALESETNDQVVQQHYKTLLRHVFEVLQQLEVPLKRE